MGNKIKVHIADDHKILIDGIVALLKTDKTLKIDGYSLTGEALLEWISKNNIEVLILDISMPVLDGIAILEFLNRNEIPHKTIVLSSYNDLHIVTKVLKLGALGYLTKSSASSHIINAIKAVAKGEQYLSSDIQKGLLHLYSEQKSKKTKMTLWEASKGTFFM